VFENKKEKMKVALQIYEKKTVLNEKKTGYKTLKLVISK
jgi:hypothetical protein